MKSKLILWLLAACLFAGAGCGDECENIGDPPEVLPFTSLDLRFYAKSDSSSFAEGLLFASDTSYRGYDFDSLLIISIDRYSNPSFGRNVDMSGIQFYFIDIYDSDNDLEKYTDQEAIHNYLVYFNDSLQDTLRIEFRLNSSDTECFGRMYDYEFFRVFYNNQPFEDLGGDKYFPKINIFKETS